MFINNRFLLTFATTTVKYTILPKIFNSNLVPRLNMENGGISKMKFAERLSHLITPINYQLHLKPDINNGTFTGNVVIKLKVKEYQNMIHLHCKNIEIKNIQLFKNQEEIQVSQYFEIKHIEQLVIKLAESISPGHYNLCIDFNGILTGKIVGFYASRLKDRCVCCS